jgi:predicted ATP-dependent endonuclease of OLD family
MRLKSVANRFSNPEIDKLFPIPHRQFTKALMEAEENGSLEDHLSKLVSTIQNFEDTTPRIKALMLQDLDNIVIAIKNKDNRAATIKTIMEYSIESEFMNSICSYGCDKAKVCLSDDDSKIYLDLNIENEKVLNVRVSHGEPLSDATYVESPLYIHMLDTLLRAETFREAERNNLRRSMLPIHIKDLAEKIDGLRLASDTTFFEKTLSINDIINGEFQYDTKKRQLFFRQNNYNISPINVASGIKSFGLVQMLLQTNTIGANKILIWDEPENHLHPEWQIAFAKLLVQLSHMGIPVLVSTHSPYFVQGVRYFAAQQDIEKYVSYYLAEIGKDNLAELREVTDDLNAIFMKLSKPLNGIMNVDLARHK